MNSKTCRSKSASGAWYDDDYYSDDYKATSYKPYSSGDYKSSEKKSGYVTKYADYSGGSKYWEKWEKQYSSYSSIFDDREKRLKLRNSFEKIARELYIPLELRFDAQDKQSAVVKTSRILMSLDKGNIASIKDKKIVREILSATDRLPENATLEDNTLFAIGMLGTRQIPFDFNGPANIEVCASAIKAYYTSGIGDIVSMRSWLRRNTETVRHEKKKTEKSESAVYGRWSDDGLRETPKELVNFLENAIKSKFYFPDTILKEENYRKGNRISRGFLNGTSYKPLVGKTRIAHKKKKLMIVVDGSGSMCAGGRGEFEGHQVMHISSAFMAGLINSDLFEINHAIIHHDGGWKNMLGEFKQRKVRGCAAGGEGFENIDETIPDAYPKDADYVLFLTDMNIGTNSQSGMAAFLKRAKKHMILSFERGGDLQGLNVRKIDSFNGMTNALSTLLA